ncbi:MAG: Hpt domain-containing protein [Pseudomonadales bacterium]|nr:Hpt domain-containing protein [Pseudomonadales bacterium]
MHVNHDYVALDWVKDEIETTLKQAQQALEAFSEKPDDITRMRFCLTYLHQVHGTLQMVEFFGASLLAEEMEMLAQAILNQQVSDSEAAQEVLVRATFQLPAYLDRIRQGRKDMPIIILPLLNELRSARGESVLSETSIFNPDMQSGNEAFFNRPQALDTSHKPVSLRQLRQLFQVAYASVLRNQDTGAQISKIAKIIKLVEQSARNSISAQLWWVARAFIECLTHSSIENNNAPKILLGILDKHLKAAVESDGESFQYDIDKQELKKFLLFIAQSAATTPLIKEVKDAFSLDGTLLSNDQLDQGQHPLTGIDRAVLKSATNALTEEINEIKDSLDIYIRSQERGGAPLQDVAERVKHSSDTLALLGMGSQRKVLMDQITTLNWCSENPQNSIVDDKLLDIAGALIYVESTLSGYELEAGAEQDETPSLTLSPQHINQAQDALIRECQAGLETAKDHIVDFIVSQWDSSHLQDVPGIFNEVSGGLSIIQQNRASTLVSYCSHYVKEHLLTESEEAPNWKVMDTLADAISSIECYLERLVDDSHTDDYILDIAESSLASMGYTIEAETVSDEGINDGAANTTDSSPNAEEPALDNSLLTPASPFDSPDNFDFDAQEPENIDSPLNDIDISDLAIPHDDAADLTSDALEAEPHVEESSSSDASLADDENTTANTNENIEASQPEEDDLIDDEIIEIFIEEVGEVLETINNYLPVWKANSEDDEALSEIRRAFHTIKGSGRLVGAIEAGELAWGVENMLNSVIEKTISVSDDMIAIIEQVIGMIPAYVTAFEQRTNAPTGGERIIEQANLIADGKSINATIEAENLAEDTETNLDIVLDAPEEERALEPELDATLELENSDPLELSNAEITTTPDDLLEPSTEEELGAFSEIEAENLAEDTDANLDIVLDTPEEELALEPELDAALELENSDPDAEITTTSDDLLEPSTEEELSAFSEGEFDEELLEIFTGEAESHLLTIHEFLKKHPVGAAPVKVSGDVLRALHTLKGSAHMANVPCIAGIISPVEQLVKQVANVDYLLHEDLLKLLFNATEVLDKKVSHIKTHSETKMVEGEELLLTEIKQLEEKYQPQQTEHSNRVSDKNFINIFLAEEMDTILEAASHLDNWEQAPHNHEIARQLEKEVTGIANHAANANIPGIEHLCNKLTECYQAAQAHQLPIDDTFFEATHLAHEALINFIDKLAAHQPIEFASEAEEKLTGILLAASSTSEENKTEPFAVDDTELETDTSASALNNIELETDEETSSSEMEREPEPHEASNSNALELDDELTEIFLEEAEEILDHLSEGINDWAKDPADLQRIDTLLRHLHTLKGSARMAGIAAIGDLTHEVETLYEKCRSSEFAFTSQLASLLNEANDAMTDMISSIQETKTCHPNLELVSRIKSYQEIGEPETSAAEAQEPASVDAISSTDNSSVETALDLDLDLDPEIIEIFLEEADEILENLSGNLERWSNDTSNHSEIEQLQRSLHTLKGGARMAGLKPIGNLSHELETLYELSTNGELPYSPEMGELLTQCHDTLADMVDAVKINTAPLEAEDLINRVIAFSKQASSEDDATVEASAEEQTSLDNAPSASNVVAISTAPSAEIDEELVIDTSDMEVMTLFVEEANELLEGIESSIEQWQSEPDSTAQKEELKRLLHTLKGSSRLAGLNQLGELSHEFESYIINQEIQPETNTETLFKNLKGHYDGLASWVEKLGLQINKEQQGLRQQDPTKELAEKTAELARKAQSAKEKPISKAEEQQEVTRAATQEMIRVSSELLEGLVNLAGEASINRAQVEKEVTDFSHTLNEIGDTIDRLQEQMRRLNMETEAQIVFTHEAQPQEEDDEYDDFDPLEMDRYSLIHQLSLSLSESTHDLTDLKDTLTNKARDTETLLLQQSRINTELQEGLMRTRLVPFARLAPRLRRMVRQVGQELGKPVELEIVNAEGEMDRAVLDRLVSPLEHMLRNSLDHGIELPEQREKLGKDKKGKITLHLSREGAEVVIRLSDDGAGIDATKVRAKAVERNLLDSHAELTDTEILQFIFKPGFSTAEKVTQISGRGVGMDVVNSEIKQLGGSTRIHSSPGVGTQFTIRLPFTVSVNRALMVKVGEDTYAIPLSHIEGIVRVSPYELETYYQPDNETPFQYAERDYDLQYLGAYVKDIPSPILLGQTQPLPVILVRGTEKPMAFQVDSLIGSREVVVKSLGPQLSSVTGLSGATILGDGNVVIILDLISMIRSDWAERLYGETHRQTATPEKTSNEIPTVMVVDDSVTVRKITSRLLERNGFQVILAKDGMDAISILQDRTPDVMLLDIEMPRMDGFEVASIVKHEERLKDISIIMITSRTGQKHRERAMSIGVDEYMGKPFQEADLLEHIGKYITVDVSA